MLCIIVTFGFWTPSKTDESPTRTIGYCSIWYFRAFDLFQTNENTLRYITYNIQKVCSYNCIQRLIDLGLSCVEIQKQFTSCNIIDVPS